MANLLETRKNKDIYDPFQEDDTNENSLQEQYMDSMQKKMKHERQFWKFSSVGLGDDVMDIDSLAEQKKHHKVFTKKSGVKGILHFLTNQRNEVENWLRNNSDPAIDHAGAKDKHVIFGRGLKYKIMKHREKLDPKDEDARAELEESKGKGKGGQPGANEESEVAKNAA